MERNIFSYSPPSEICIEYLSKKKVSLYKISSPAEMFDIRPYFGGLRSKLRTQSPVLVENVSF